MSKLRSSRRFRCKGFTLSELIIALMVSSIVLTAVATLASALSSANAATRNAGEKQAQIRNATLRVAELIKHSKLICSLEENNLAIWRADDNGDGQINLDELVYIGSNWNRNYLRLFEYYSDNRALSLGDIQPLVSGWWKYGINTYRITQLIPECENLQFIVDSDPPWTSYVQMSFDITENGRTSNYQICAMPMTSGDYLLDQSGNLRTGDDDQ